MRLHQEDFCQALHLQTALKYQPPGHPVSYPGLMRRLLEDASADVAADRLALAQRFVFAVGNSDNHLKNSSLLYARDWRSRRLAPAYDVTCIPLTGYSTSMAYDVGSHRKLAEIEPDDVLAALSGFGVSGPAAANITGAVIDGLSGVDAGDCEDADTQIVHAILRDSAPRLRVIDEVARTLGRG